ncbi:MAG: serine hydrolase domain-containing protein [Nannocystales bacterium]
MDPGRVAALLEAARTERSAALLLWVDGDLVIDEAFGSDPRSGLFAMSVSKSVVALRVGQLVDAGLLELDAPLSASVMPEWMDTDKETITLRHLLSHTSGLDPQRYGNDAKSFRHATIEEHAQRTPLVAPVGETFAYNNNAVDILAVIVRRATSNGMALDDQLQAGLFGPLDIAGAYWMKDGRGDPRASGELVIRPHDLLKIGRLVLDRGMYGPERLLSKAWIDTMLEPGPNEGCGLLWWLDRREGDSEVAAYVADGYLGQYIVVIPEFRAVAVRMRDPNTTSWSPEEFTYPEFRRDVLQLFTGGAARSRPRAATEPPQP